MSKLAHIYGVNAGYEARFERHLKHAVDEVWSWLTVNDKLKKWFSELSIDELREGGVIKFDMQNGDFEELKIVALEIGSVLEFTWDEDLVRFELYPESEGCRLVLLEKLTKLTDHTPRDIAGWDVCLDVIEVLLDGKTIESRTDVWKIKYEQYKEAIAALARA
ncbi:activator of Hsp90 ATPase 1 family protein [Paenibacillus sp. FSL H8-0548]|uniref:SRPBCC family protein n=1 Tax=Paenibacillus sp. FSL H8-0548 TaxID=1920422 RepID=UPI00096DD156|nr:SRPBCC family protein [Paenibacillus sp. FSL H8-0548]OMF27624.1 activator of Hsp90 ATPase 1 family protein [Paenibacillus sp. FSL H8-0548]